METKFVNISEAKARYSREYCESWLGKQAIFKTYEGEELVGTITHWMHSYPCVTFDNGTWARLDARFKIVL